MISVQLLSGDMVISADGTVTQAEAAVVHRLAHHLLKQMAG